MPYSDPDGKPVLLRLLADDIAPGASFLDVGPGSGFYGRWLKERGGVADAVEIHSPYVERFGLRGVYRQVFENDIRSFRPATAYTCCILGDVLEHLPAIDAQALIERLPELAGRALFSVPWTYPQGEAEGNPHERHHQDDLTAVVMAERYPQLKLVYCGPIIGVYLWRR